MKRLIPAGLLLAVGAASCDSPAGPPAIDRVVVTPATHSLNVGTTVQLSAVAQTAGGQAVTDAVITWQSLDFAVASVSGGLVTGLQGGTARIVASSTGKADTAVITVVAPSVECVPASTLTMTVGEARRLDAGAASVFCLDGTSAGAEFTVVPFFASSNQRSTVQLTFEGTGLQDAVGPPTPSITPSFSLATAGATAARGSDGGFHLALRERTEPALRPLVPGAQATYAARRRSGGARFDVTAAAAPSVGDLLTYNVETDGRTYDEVCNTMSDYRTGRVEAVGVRSVIVADTANPADGLTTADYARVAAAMDTLVWPVVAGTFGEPADIDDNQRVVIFYTRAVNELTPAGANYVVGGFFYSRDLFPKTPQTGFQPCPLSNEAEMFYMLAADPTGVVNGHQRSTEYVINGTIGTVGHELQHLISASRRLYVHNTGNYSEEVWLNEGLSHIAEELMFYRSSGMSPLSNIDLDALRASQRRVDAVNRFQVNNLGRFRSYLDAPESSSPFSPDDELATRGSIWAFLRYAADRRGGDQQQLWYDLVNNTRLGLNNLGFHLGVDPVAWARDWNVALYTDDAVAGVGPELTQPSWNFRSIYPALTSSGTYPLRTRPFTSSASFTLRASGAAYLRTAVAPGGTGRVGVTSGGAALPTSVSLTVVRTR
jgi:hypothetical protein